MKAKADNACAEDPLILVLEDDNDLRYQVSDMLRGSGYRVAETVTADDALQYLLAVRDVCLVIADIRVPGTMDGLDLAHAIHDKFPAIKVIVTSGIRKEPIPEGALFLRKPFLISRLLGEVRAALPPPR